MPNFIQRAVERAREQRIANERSALEAARGRVNRGAANQTDLSRINVAEVGADIAGQDLMQLLEQYFGPQVQGLGEREQAIEQELLEALRSGPDFGLVQEGLETSAQGLLGELERPGGMIDEAIFSGLSQAGQRGIGPQGGTFERSLLNVTGRTGDLFADLLAQQAPQLAQIASGIRGQNIQGLGGLFQTQAGRADQARSDLFTGRLNIENLRMAQRQLAEQSLLNRENLALAREQQSGGGIGGFLGGLAGTVIGSIGGPIGSAIGNRIGSSIFGGGGGATSAGTSTRTDFIGGNTQFGPQNTNPFQFNFNNRR